MTDTDIKALYEPISTSSDLRELYEEGVNEFVTHTALLALRAVIDTEIELKCGRPHQRSKQHPCYRHGRQKTGYIVVNGQKHNIEKPLHVAGGRSGRYFLQVVIDGIPEKAQEPALPAIFILPFIMITEYNITGNTPESYTLKVEVGGISIS